MRRITIPEGRELVAVLFWTGNVGAYVVKPRHRARGVTAIKHHGHHIATTFDGVWHWMGLGSPHVEGLINLHALSNAPIIYGKHCSTTSA